MSIGDGCFINWNVFVDNSAAVEIGDNVFVGMDSMIVTSTHEMGEAFQRAGHPLGLQVRIGSGCWLGARAVVLPGVTLGPGVVLAAGSVAADDCIEKGVYAGVPARLVRPM